MKTSPLAGESRMAKTRILFFGEAVTLAHVARPAALASSLDASRYEICFAAHPRYNALLGKLPYSFRSIQSIASQQFLQALAKGNPMYDRDTLAAYVEEDLAVIREFRPDVVVGDFRLSLAVSARMAGVRYMAILNAYWSPHARRHFPMPELAISRGIGVPLSRVLFQLLRPVGFAFHAHPMNVTRHRYGMKSLGRDPRRIYSEADEVLYADIAELVPTFDRPVNHRYIGPIHWSPKTLLPDWWHAMPTGRPVIYVTLGTSGPVEVLGATLWALAGLPVTVIAATAGRVTLDKVPANAYVSDYLPGDEAAARARLVICNGGSPTTQQALTAGVPVLGVPSNMDQHINMHYVVQSGAGRMIRAGQVTESVLQSVVQSMLRDEGCSKRAMALAQVMRQHDATERFEAAIAAKPVWQVKRAGSGAITRA